MDESWRRLSCTYNTQTILWNQTKTIKLEEELSNINWDIIEIGKIWRKDEHHVKP